MCRMTKRRGLESHGKMKFQISIVIHSHLYKKPEKNEDEEEEEKQNDKLKKKRYESRKELVLRTWKVCTAYNT